MSLLGEPIPGYVNRCAYIASFFSCLFPRTDKDTDSYSTKRFNGEANHLTSVKVTSSSDVCVFHWVYL